MAIPKFIAIDEQNRDYAYIERFPRKELMDFLGAKSAQKIYVDLADGTPLHIGYKVRSQWFRVFKIQPFKEVTQDVRAKGN